ncbi:sigma 54-interacting transcriptional regulator [Planctomicrobium sp. SH668]|uniref:sigma 54-interacting transcriptional regulator n=1 Tax=Planctomicrobium sp. SH668 TaxID=3448126 RepID=UPI003F5B261A
MNGRGIQRWSISALAAFAISYGLVVMWYVPTQPCMPLRCLLTNATHPDARGLEIRDVRLLKGLSSIKGTVPEVGDRIIEAAGHPIRSFADWAKVHRVLRNWKSDSASRLSIGADPTEESSLSNLSVFEFLDKSRAVLVWFERDGVDEPLLACLPLIGQSTFDVSITLLWYMLQLCVVIVGGVATWNRPFDQPLRAFFALSALTLMAFVGGSHWWLISASPTLIILFTIVGCILPATLLHFFLMYPFAPSFFAHDRWWMRVLLYFVPVMTGVVLAGLMLITALLTVDFGPGPFASTLERLIGNANRSVFPIMRNGVYFALGMELMYFILSVLAIRRSCQVARNPFERNQVTSLLWGAIVAGVLIVFTFYLAVFHHVYFAFGGARIPMFGASLAFMFAYAVGIARYKLLLIDQVVSSGVWYYSASAGLTVIFAALISVSVVNTMQQNFSPIGQAIPLTLVLMISVLVVIWVRDSIQKKLDRKFFSAKYQLDKALNRVNRVVSSVLEPEAVADSLLNSCCEILHVDQASLYLRKGTRLEFRMSTAVGDGHLPLNITLEQETFEAITEHLVIQRIPHQGSPTQSVLRQLRAEVVHGLEIREHMGGLLVLGAKRNNLPYSAEDLAFVDAMARISGVALHCATVQKDVARLNQDLQLKMNKIEDQERQLSALHSELASLSETPVRVAIESDLRREDIKGHGPAMSHVLETVKKVAGSNSSVLVRGESGTGKELLAKALHDNSPRRNGPLVSVHCGALSSNLLESELFGHVKGAFTDAHQDKVGRFQAANGGTLFLDEIGDISLDVQVKLLRVLQERTFEPVGSSKSISTDVRIVAATHRNLEQLIAEGLFREDLFYRLNVISITLPPLRDRREDLYELALHFLRRASGESGKSVFQIDDAALRLMQSYDWPGNIRELQNVIERAVVLTDGNSIRVQDLTIEVSDPRASRNVVFSDPLYRPRIATSSQRSAPPAQSVSGPNSEEDEKMLLIRTLASCQGNKAEAARLLGMPRSTFFSKLKKNGLS